MNGKYYVEEAMPNQFVLHRPDGSWMAIEFCEMKAIESFMRRNRWKNEIMNQIEYDSDNLILDGEIDAESFVRLCMDDIDANREIYGGEDYEPDIEAIVFDVAQDNDVWRD